MGICWALMVGTLRGMKCSRAYCWFVVGLGPVECAGKWMGTRESSRERYRCGIGRRERIEERVRKYSTWLGRMGPQQWSL
ncbi:hypothetical protein F5B17DRAFT_407148 [Nemania serpens]|nr:hypothetical protein F5B17DRAFT_407148 [Nemania serpens]